MNSHNRTPDDSETTRRDFLRGVAVVAGGIALTGRVGDALASTLPASKSVPAALTLADQIGLELWTVRDLTAKDFIGTLEKVAAIGYKEIEPATGYGNLTPKQFRSHLDRLGLKAPSTHSGITAGPDADVEKQLADSQIMGIEYVSLSEPRPAGAQQGQRRPRASAPGAMSPAARREQMAQFARAAAKARAADDVKEEAARYNKVGKLAQKYGIKLLIHNHTVEFIPCKDSDPLPYSILLAETDPSLVVFQMDIGWATGAGQNPIQLFQQHPGRFVLWHVKDAACLKSLPPTSDQGGRMVEARLLPVGFRDPHSRGVFKYP